MSSSDSTSPSDDALLRAIAQDSELAPREDHALGSRVGRFLLERELGRGGMGIVYCAHDDRLGRAVALKVLARRRERDPDRRARFLREARSAASIVHPNVAAVYEIGEADETLFIAMELVAGTSLRQRLAQEGALPIAEATALAVGIARGLAAAHDKQIVHRDLKPENVMVEPTGEAKILDFGLAKLHDVDSAREVLEQQPTRSPSTEDGRILGTPGYMSPEQAAGRPLDGRSDLFSLGVVLYEMLAGTRPFAFETTAEALAAVLRDDPPPLRSVPAGLSTLVMQCLAKAPADRPADARTLARRLEQTPAPAPRSRVPLFVAAAAVAIAAGVIASRSSAPPAPRPTASAAPGAAAPRGVPMNALPPPRTSVPAAAAAYAAGLTSIRDGAWELGAQSFVRAAKLDPALAAAHLRAGLYGFAVGPTGGILPSQARESTVTATRFRGSLDERDLALLHIAEALALDPPDYAQTVSRSREAVARYSGDVEIGAQLAMALPWVDKLDEARAEYARLLALDPGFAGALLQIGEWDYDLRRNDDAIATFDRCLALSPAASSCLRWRAEVHDARGECAAIEADARRLLQIEPTSPQSYELLARALAGRGASTESISLALDRMVTLGADISPLYSRSVAKYWLTMLDGDLSGAEAALLETDRAFAGETSASSHEIIFETLTKLAIERGEAPAAAARFNADVERVSAARSPDSPGGLSTLRLYELHRSKRLSDEEFERERERRYRDSLALYPVPSGTADFDDIFILVFVAPSRTKDEMRDALQRLDARADMHDQWGLTARLYLEAGRFDDALKVLRPAAARCGVIPETTWATAPSTWWWLDKHRELGEALEAKGDKAGACTAYGVIAKRWKNAKPRSVTLEKAKERMRVLGCGRGSPP